MWRMVQAHVQRVATQNLALKRLRNPDSSCEDGCAAALLKPRIACMLPCRGAAAAPRRRHAPSAGGGLASDTDLPASEASPSTVDVFGRVAVMALWPCRPRCKVGPWHVQGDGQLHKEARL